MNPFALRNPADGRVHWSDLKHMARSPAHARHALTSRKEPTPAMRIGSAVDSIIFGGRSVVTFDGVRRGKLWDEFSAANSAAIVLSAKESCDARGAVDAIADDPTAAVLISSGKTQVVCQWEHMGLPFAAGIQGERGGLDVLGSDWIADLKVTSTTEPRAWERQAWRMLYPAQLALYRSAHPHVKRCYIIGVEARAPHCVTVLELSASSLELGDKMVASWCESVRACEASGHWPGYVQTPILMEPPSWQYESEGESEEDQ
jgi:PDDEXK-like domain of unknown function (DUF3799)